jgi:hypothetical protein
VTWYVPVLSGHRAEITALSAAREAVAVRMRPVLEFAPGNSEPPAAAVRRLVEQRIWAPSVGLDCRAYYADERATNLLPALAETLAAGSFPLPVLPVLWPDSPDRLVAEAAAVAAGSGAGVYLRVPVAGKPGSPTALRRLLRRARLGTDQVDLLLDLGEVAKDVVLATAVDRAIAAVLAGTGAEAFRWGDRGAAGGWRSVTLLAGGWPSRRRLPLPPAVTVLPRNDAALWAKVQAAVPDVPLGFGDFGVRARSAIGSGGRGSPAPYLRYTVEDNWELRRWPKTSEGGLETIQPLCQDLIRSVSYLRYGSAYSWGDAEIGRAGERGASAADRRSPTAWAAWSVSHHLAVVTDRLRSVGMP